MDHRRAALLGVGAGLAVLLAWILTSDRPAPDARHDGAAEPRVEPPAPARLASPDVPAAPSATAPAAPAPPVGEPPAGDVRPAILRVRVVDRAEHRTIVGARVLVHGGEWPIHLLRASDEEPVGGRTGSDGTVEVLVPLSAAEQRVRVDAVAMGYGSAAGAYCAGGGRAPEVTLLPGVVSTVTVRLARGFLVAGTVRDERGAPVPGVVITACVEDRGSTCYYDYARTDLDGRFEVYDLPRPDDPDSLRTPESQARLHFDHPDFVETVSPDLYPLSEEARGSLDVRMARGLTVEGTVRGVPGRSSADLLVEVLHLAEDGAGAASEDAKPGPRRSVRTGHAGEFVLRGVPPGKARFFVADYARRLVGRAEAVLSADRPRVTIDLAPVPGERAGAPVRLLGLDLVEMTEEERVAYGFPTSYRVLITGAEPGHEALGVGTLEPGDCLWHVESVPVASVREFAEILVHAAESRVPRRWASRGAQADVPPVVTVDFVYGMRREGGFVGTNTQHLKLTAEQVASVKAWLGQASR